MAIKKPLDPQDLPRNFNLVSTDLDPETEYGKHFRHANYWTEKILKLCFFLNIGTIIFLVIGMVGFLLKPEPSIYGTTQLGSLYPLQGITRNQALALIEQNKAKLSGTQNLQSTTAMESTDITTNNIIANSGGNLSSVPSIPGNPIPLTQIPTPVAEAPLSNLSENQSNNRNIPGQTATPSNTPSSTNTTNPTAN